MLKPRYLPHDVAIVFAETVLTMEARAHELSDDDEAELIALALPQLLPLIARGASIQLLREACAVRVRRRARVVRGAA